MEKAVTGTERTIRNVNEEGGKEGRKKAMEKKEEEEEGKKVKQLNIGGVPEWPIRCDLPNDWVSFPIASIALDHLPSLLIVLPHP